MWYINLFILINVTSLKNSRLQSTDFNNLPFGMVFSDHMLICNFKNNSWGPIQIKEYGDIPILAAGGIATGEQMAGVMAMGADGVWCASVFLTTTEAETSETVKEKMVNASSSQTVRSRSRTGKHSRQLKSAWTDAWEAKDAPEPLPMPLQTMVGEPALAIISKHAEIGHEGAKDLETYWVGQGIGLVNETISAGQTVQKFKEEFIEGYERMTSLFEE